MHPRFQNDIRRFALLTLFAAAAACHPAAAPVEVPRLSESEAAALVLLANAAEASYAEVAGARTRRDDVRAFARRVATDHAALGLTLGELLARDDITPASDDVTDAFRGRALARRAALRAASDAAFDSVYVATEVLSHQELLEMIDQQIAPASRHRALTAYLAEFRPAVRAHLAAAEQARATLLAR